MAPSIAARIDRLRGLLSELDADAFLITHPDNRRYFSGFTGSAGALLISHTQALISTDFRYYEQVRLEAPVFELVQAPNQLSDVLAGMVARTAVRRLAFEADHATVADAQSWLQAVPGLEWVSSQGRLIELRSVKDEGELAALRSAIALADAALAAALGQARPGIAELDLSWLIESYIRTHGGEAAFDLIVTAGPNGSRPHARATDAPLVAGEPIVIDMGAKIAGYRSDLTRTVCFGLPRDAERFWKVYNTVLKAQAAAVAALRPGLTGVEGDAVARDVITDAGYGEYFGHGLGHGVGLAIHEQPRLSRFSKDTLAPGHVVTVEPGIYLPGWGGVRIEDIVLITDTGAEVLSRAPKEPIIQSTPALSGDRSYWSGR